MVEHRELDTTSVRSYENNLHEKMTLQTQEVQGNGDIVGTVYFEDSERNMAERQK